MLGKRILASFLAVLTILGCMTLAISVAAEEAEAAPVYEYNTNRYTPTMSYLTGEYPPNLEGTADDSVERVKITTQKQKLEIMDLRLQKDGYRLYVDEYSGEVAVENISTGEVLFSNPYDVGAVDKIGENNVTPEEKRLLLSQIFIKYSDITNSSATDKTYSSFFNAVRGGVKDDNKNTVSQIVMKEIKNGIRAEYSIGRIDSRYLVPEKIPKALYEEEILAVLEASDITKTELARFKTLYSFLDLEAELADAKTDKAKQDIKDMYLATHPEAEKGPFYYISKNISDKNRDFLESCIKRYCPDFTLEDLDRGYTELGYVSEDKSEPLFKVSLEYTLDKDGLSVRLPANGIRFDESIYRLENITILPYMGAGRNPNTGYSFYPDGSGALFAYEDHVTKKTSTTYGGKIYGEDFAYYNIGTNRPHNETVRYPVFGMKEDMPQADGSTRSRGFLAIIEEGEALMELTASHTNKYHSVQMTVNPRPYDKYKLSNVISAAGTSDAFMCVVSERKYTDSIKIKYIMLTDPKVKTGEGYYETSYVGMAKAYRDYLVKNGTLKALTDNDVRDDLPLFIESVGAIQTTEKFLTIPYTAVKTLTSFDDIRKMYEDLALVGEENADAEQKIENINFILTGFTKGGIGVDYVPYNLKWDSAVEKGGMKFDELLDYADKNSFGVYPDVDFVFFGTDEWFDGYSKDSHAVLTVDGRYISKREYYATRQTYVSYFELAISPASFSRFYEKFAKNYNKYNPSGISLSTLGTYLNSDFDEDEPYNREESKAFTIKAFEFFDKSYDTVITSGGNAYSWKYVDYITDIATDSSRHARAAATVPFLGIVLHGYKQTVSEPINMEGNMEYAMLRAIENGTSLKFILSYQNTEELKQYIATNKYYSVRYDVWRDDLFEKYHEINNLLKDVQLETIEQHKFLEGVRIPNIEELAEDAEKELFNSIADEIKNEAADREAERKLYAEVRRVTLALAEKLEGKGTGIAAEFSLQLAELRTLIADMNSKKTEADAAQKAHDDFAAVKLPADATDEQKQANKEEIERLKKAADDAKTAYDEAVKTAKEAYESFKQTAEAFDAEYTEPYKFVQENIAAFTANSSFADAEKALISTTFAGLADDYAIISSTAFTVIRDEAAQEIASVEETYAELFGIVKAEEKEEEKTDTVVASAYNKYATPRNSIVYEQYSNGKTFVLNFNSYAVKVVIDGVTYSIAGYGYIVLK